jgi:hypothetical protein
MEYIVIFENDHKDDSHTLYFCQWTGYEERLRDLCKFMTANQTHGDFGEGFSYSYSENRLSAPVVDAMADVRTAGYTNMRCWKHDTATEKSTAAYDNFLKYVREHIAELNQTSLLSDDKY